MEELRSIRKSDVEYYLDHMEAEGHDRDKIIDQLKRASMNAKSIRSRIYLRSALRTIGVV